METLFSLFLHPVAAIVGGLLASLPVIIHLIRRTQFKKQPWAAMEFLLAAQKRMRRRMVLEEWILLALRILLVLLVAFLLSRWLGGGASGVGGDHIVILDDSISMADARNDRGTRKTAFDSAMAEGARLARKLGATRGIHHLRFFLLSSMTEPILEGRAGEDLARQAELKLARLKPSYYSLDPTKGIEASVEKWSASTDSPASSHRILHLITDCRDTDFGGPKQEESRRIMTRLVGSGASLRIVDVSDPERPNGSAIPIGHDNLAITGLSCESRLVVEGAATDFVATIKNFGSSPRRTFFHARRDGVEDFAATQPVDEIPPGQEIKLRFTLVLGRNSPGPKISSGDDPMKRDQERLLHRSWIRLSGEIDDQPTTGLAEDNVRDLVVEVVHKVPVLVIDGAGRAGMTPGGDSFHIDAALSALRDFDPEIRTVEELPKTRLELYPIVFMLNVAELPSVEVERLLNHVSEGASLSWFVGDRTRPAFVNGLFQDKNGLFPILLAPKPVDPVPSQEKLDSRLLDEQPKILFPDPAHPIVAGVYPNRLDFRFLPIDRHWPAQARFLWDKGNGLVKDIILLPNKRWKDDRQRAAYRDKALALITTFPLANPSEAAFRSGLDSAIRDIREALLSQSQFQLARALEKTLEDAGDLADAKTKSPARPGLRQLWSKPAFVTTAQAMGELLREIQFGDPLWVERSLGRGKVFASMTMAGTKTTMGAAGAEADGWNEWGSGSPMSWSYAALMKELVRHLLKTGERIGGTETKATDLVGNSFELIRDASFLSGGVRERFDPQTPTKVPGFVPEGQKLGMNFADAPVSGKVRIKVLPSRVPGVLYLNMSPAVVPGQPIPGPEDGELEAFAFNIDANHEGDLRRTRRDLLEMPSTGPGTGRVVLSRPGDGHDSMLEPPRDTSESWWIYLLVFGVLIGEQAMAVYCSHHGRSAKDVGVVKNTLAKGTRVKNVEPVAVGGVQ